MRSSKVSFLSLLVMTLFLFQSCAKDEALVEEQFLQVAADDFSVDDIEGEVLTAALTELDNDVVREWTETLLEVERYAGGMRPNATARALAYIYLASYETAVPGMQEYDSTERSLRGLQIDAPRNRGRGINWEIALNESFAKTLDHFLINVPASATQKIMNLQSELEQSLAANTPQRVVQDSKRWGAYVADQVIAYSQTDQAAEAQILEPQPLSYEPPTAPGYWTYSAAQERALFPYWGTVRTFMITPKQTTSVPPIPYSEEVNSPYFAEMKEVYDINNAAKKEDGEQLWIAEFWSDDVENLTFSPPARQYSIANQLVQQYDLGMEETLVLYVKLGFSLNDAAVATWKYKYDYMVMRPNVYIHEFIDADYQTNLYRLVYWPNPSFPGYPSGHSCFASAAAGIFIEQFGNTTSFTDRSHEGREEFKSAARTFSSFEELAEENAFSRIPLGVHIRMDCTEGLRLGYEISAAANRLNLRRNPN